MLESPQAARSTRIFILQVTQRGCNMLFDTLGWIYTLYTHQAKQMRVLPENSSCKNSKHTGIWSGALEATHVVLFWDVPRRVVVFFQFLRFCLPASWLAIWSYHGSIKSSPLRNLGKSRWGKMGSTESTAWFCAGKVGRVKRSNRSKRKSKGPLRFFIGVKLVSKQAVSITHWALWTSILLEGLLQVPAAHVLHCLGCTLRATPFIRHLDCRTVNPLALWAELLRWTNEWNNPRISNMTELSKQAPNCPLLDRSFSEMEAICPKGAPKHEFAPKTLLWLKTPKLLLLGKKCHGYSENSWLHILPCIREFRRPPIQPMPSLPSSATQHALYSFVFGNREPLSVCSSFFNARAQGKLSVLGNSRSARSEGRPRRPVSATAQAFHKSPFSTLTYFLLYFQRICIFSYHFVTHWRPLEYGWLLKIMLGFAHNVTNPRKNAIWNSLMIAIFNILAWSCRWNCGWDALLE